MIRETKGTSALGLIAALSIGTFISLGYANVSRYIAARNALEQATVLTLRCLTPTDPDCIKLSPRPSVSAWHYFGSVNSPSGELYGREFRYSATMFRTRYGFDAEYYRIPQSYQPRLEIKSVTLPIASFHERTLRKKVMATYRYDADLPWNRAIPRRPAFPAWDAGLERDHDTEPFAAFQSDPRLSAGEKLLRSSFVPVFTRSIDIEFGSNLDLERRLTWNNIGQINMSRLLGGEAPTTGCYGGENCNVSALASSTPSSDPNDYLHRRYLALYLQVHLTRVSPGVALGIQGKDGEPGFSISTSEGHQIDLGGRDLQKIDSLEGKYFNLWLRGPVNARGGDDQTLPEHSGIALPMDGWFSPEISFRANGGNGDSLRGEVTLFAFADTYKSLAGSDHVDGLCPAISLIPGQSPELAAPTKAACLVSPAAANFHVALVGLEEQQLGCISDLSGEFADSWPAMDVPALDVMEPRRQVVALCNGDEHPLQISACGWDKEDSSSESLEFSGNEALSCKWARAQTPKSLVCNSSPETVDACDVTSSPQECSNYSEQKKYFDSLIISAQARGIQIPLQLNQMELGASLIPGDAAPDRLSCSIPSPKNLSAGCFTLEKRPIATFPQWEEVLAPTNLPQFEFPADLDPLRSCLSVQASDAHPVENSVPIKVTGYPFDGESELELNGTIPEKISGELSCAHSPLHSATLEELLRKFAAANGFADAENPLVRFEVEARDLHTERLVKRIAGCRPESFASADDCARLSFRQLGEEQCGSPIDLGVIPDNLAPPPQCEGAEMSCSKLPESILDTDQPSLPDMEHASQEATNIGMQVLKRYLPDLISGCSSAGCGSVAVDLSDPEMATVSASYDLPLTWPLDLLLQRKAAHLEIRKRERFEAR